ncbi:MAG: molecular chaperone TorD family protein [Nitrococcus sp.]|nr:molecular chaperone TorD family protein [Nitrococcus sp.]
MSNLVMVVPKRVFMLFGTILDYPTRDLSAHIAECAEVIGDRAPASVADLESFREEVEGAPLGYLEEVHTAFFDLNPVCRPYVGYHLFGETYRRSMFMIRLKEIYAQNGFEFPKNDLPDRLSVFLSFLGTNDDNVLGRELIDEALAPTMAKMTGMEVPVSRVASGRGRARSAKKEKEEVGPVPGGAEAGGPERPGTGGGSEELQGHSHGGEVDDGVLLDAVHESAGVASGASCLYVKPLRSLARIIPALWEPGRQAAAGRGEL